MSYSLFHGRYDGNILVGKADTAFSSYRPFAWTAGSSFQSGQEPGPDTFPESELRGARVFQVIGPGGWISASPQVDANYDINLDLGEAAAIARRPEVRRGALRLTGHGSWSAQDFSTIGKVLLSNLDWKNAAVGLNDANLSVQYNVTPKQLKLTQLEGRVLGGSFTGAAEDFRNGSILRLPASSPSSTQNHAKRPKSLKPTSKPALLHLRYKDLSAQEIASSVGHAFASVSEH